MNSIVFMDCIDDALAKRMQDDLVATERSQGIDINYRLFSIVISDENNQPCGVLNAYTAFSEIYIDDLWVDSTHRKKGYGRKLVKALEDHFTGKGFNNINLCTSAFQAPDFYEKCGFIAEFTRENKINPKLSKTFFVKFFEDKEQVQGL